MDRIQGELVISSMDLGNYMVCKHAVELDKKRSIRDLENRCYPEFTLGLNEYPELSYSGQKPGA